MLTRTKLKQMAKSGSPGAADKAVENGKKSRTEKANSTASPPSSSSSSSSSSSPSSSSSRSQHQQRKHQGTSSRERGKGPQEPQSTALKRSPNGATKGNEEVLQHAPGQSQDTFHSPSPPASASASASILSPSHPSSSLPSSPAQTSASGSLYSPPPLLQSSSSSSTLFPSSSSSPPPLASDATATAAAPFLPPSSSLPSSPPHLPALVSSPPHAPAPQHDDQGRLPGIEATALPHFTQYNGPNALPQQQQQQRQSQSTRTAKSKKRARAFSDQSASDGMTPTPPPPKFHHAFHPSPHGAPFSPQPSIPSFQPFPSAPLLARPFDPAPRPSSDHPMDHYSQLQHHPQHHNQQYFPSLQHKSEWEDYIRVPVDQAMADDENDTASVLADFAFFISKDEQLKDLQMQQQQQQQQQQFFFQHQNQHQHPFFQQQQQHDFPHYPTPHPFQSQQHFYPSHLSSQTSPPPVSSHHQSPAHYIPSPPPTSHEPSGHDETAEQSRRVSIFDLIHPSSGPSSSSLIAPPPEDHRSPQQQQHNSIMEFSNRSPTFLPPLLSDQHMQRSGENGGPIPVDLEDSLQKTKTTLPFISLEGEAERGSESSAFQFHRNLSLPRVEIDQQTEKHQFHHHHQHQHFSPHHHDHNSSNGQEREHGFSADHQYQHQHQHHFHFQSPSDFSSRPFDSREHPVEIDPSLPPSSSSSSSSFGLDSHHLLPSATSTQVSSHDPLWLSQSSGANKSNADDTNLTSPLAFSGSSNPTSPSSSSSSLRMGASETRIIPSFDAPGQDLDARSNESQTKHNALTPPTNGVCLPATTGAI